MTSLRATKDSFRAIGETCPHVDEAASDFIRQLDPDIDDRITELVNSVKDQTTGLRAALTEAMEERNAAQDRVSYLEEQVQDLRRELDSALAEIQALEAAT